jgi:hypothetical protein
MVSSTIKTDFHDITEILLKVALNTIHQPTKPKTLDETDFSWKINDACMICSVGCDRD